MSNTIQSATNSFSKGIIMDFSPEVSGNESLVNALNATLLTYNGNEMALQNDMGNGRVETARLPEGYVPVGACEFGDIIYVVSYNPLLNRSQIGCFPSPERIIESDEIGTENVTISSSDFQELNNNDQPTGKLKTNSKKFIVFGNTLNPGDKYIISATGLEDNINKITGISDDTAKYIKLSVVSIEDSGRITYLDTDVNKYEITGNNEPTILGHYFLKQQKGNDSTEEKSDIDNLRSNIQSGYQVFKSKVSGKLAILAELETINSFSCTYRLNVVGNTSKTPYFGPNRTCNINGTNYNIELDIKYDSDNGVEPQGWILTESERTIDKFPALFFENGEYSAIDEGTYNICPFSIPTSSEHDLPNSENEKIYILNNSNNTPYNFFIPENGTIETQIEGLEQTDPINIYFSKENCVYNFTVAPYMPYGILSEFGVPLSVDFSKVNTGIVELNKWKYYNTDNFLTLTLGLDVYLEPNTEVDEVELKFYDDSGYAASYHIKDRISYSGVFTEYIPLNGESNSYNLDYSGNRTDGGILKSKLLYLVKIIVKYTNSNKTVEFVRCLWTNKMFNDFYYNTDDFNNIQFSLGTDLLPEYLPTDTFKQKQFEYEPEELLDSSTQAAVVNNISGKLAVNIYPYLSESYDCFILNQTHLNEMGCDLFLKGHTIEQENFVLKSLNSNPIDNDYSVADSGEFAISQSLKDKLEDTTSQVNDNELWQNSAGYVNHMNPVIEDTLVIDQDGSEEKYIDLQGNECDLRGSNFYHKDFNVNTRCAGYNYNPNIVDFNKYFIQSELTQTLVNTLKPFIYYQSDLPNFGLTYRDEHALINTLLEFRMYEHNQTGVYKFVYRVRPLGDNGTTSFGDNNTTGSFNTTYYEREGGKNVSKISQFTILQNEAVNIEEFNKLGKFFLAKVNTGLGDPSGTNNYGSNDTVTYSNLMLGVRTENGFHLFNHDLGENITQTISLSSVVTFYPRLINGEEIFLNGANNTPKEIKSISKDLNRSECFNIELVGSTNVDYILKKEQGGWCIYNHTETEIIYQQENFDQFYIKKAESIWNLDNSENIPNLIDMSEISELYIGDMIVSIFGELYPSKTTLESKQIQTIKDVIFKDVSKTTYTQEFVARLTINDDNNFDQNQLINLLGVDYSYYIGNLKNNSELQDFDWNKLSSNMNVKLNKIINTIPLQFVVEARNPGVTYTDGSNQYVYLFGKSTPIRKSFEEGNCKELTAEGQLQDVSEYHINNYYCISSANNLLLKGDCVKSEVNENILYWLKADSDDSLQLKDNYPGSNSYSIKFKDNNSYYVDLTNLSKRDILYTFGNNIMSV